MGVRNSNKYDREEKRTVFVPSQCISESVSLKINIKANWYKVFLSLRRLFHCYLVHIITEGREGFRGGFYMGDMLGEISFLKMGKGGVSEAGKGGEGQ